MKKVLAAVLVGAGLMITGVQAEAQTKIGYVNTQELYSLLPEIRKIDSSLRAYQEVLQKTGEDYQEEFQTKLAKFNADSAKLTAPVKEVERQKLQDLYSRAVGYEQEVRQKLQAKQQELLGPVQKTINTTISQVAKENGYTYVFEREVFLVVPDADNLLPLIKKKMNLK